LEIPDVGHCGGLLVVSGIGRPLEFHCCSPVKPNRAQSILYGKTYNRFLFGEQIGLSLVEKTSIEPQIFIANRPELLVLNSLINVPTVYIQKDDPEITLTEFDPVLRATKKLRLDDFDVFCDTGDKVRCQAIESVLGSFTKTLTLDEPFERIQKAIDEAQAVAG
jgi:hypothetical protein